ncbi:MAG: hypothetical protein GF353_24855, partial [Candidatus Lokiarchaeota archaeon]|nr:hypothetical protein [Candidatus Lokiarchaeota archaeon]
MEEILKIFNISEGAARFYMNILGEFPLSYSELRALSSSISETELESIVNELIENELVVSYSPRDTEILTHYVAIPPIFVVIKGLQEIKTTINQNSKKSGIFEDAINQVFENQTLIELEKIYKDVKILQEDIEIDISTIKQELDGLVDEIEEKGVKVDPLQKYEEEIKNLINSQLASIVIILLHLKSEFKDKLEKIGINHQQWDALKDNLKDILALEVHNKSQELNEIVSKEFNEIRSELKGKIQGVLKDRVEQKSVYLGLLNMFKNEINKLYKVIILKRNNLKIDLKSLETLISKRMSEIFKSSTNSVAENISYLESFAVDF